MLRTPPRARHTLPGSQSERDSHVQLMPRYLPGSAVPRLSAPIKRSLRAQCILRPPPPATRANSREASVFSIFLLMMLPQSGNTRFQCILPPKLMCILPPKLMCILPPNRMSPPTEDSVKPADIGGLTITCLDSTGATLASATHCTCTNCPNCRTVSCQIGQHSGEGSAVIDVERRHRHPHRVVWVGAAAEYGAAQLQTRRPSRSRNTSGGSHRGKRRRRVPSHQTALPPGQLPSALGRTVHLADR